MPDKQPSGADGDIPLTTIPWTESEELRVSINEYRGTRYFAVRVWFEGKGKAGQYFPGRNGINVPLNKVEEFFKAVIEGKKLFDGMVKRGHVTLPARE